MSRAPSVQELRERFADRDPSPDELAELRADSRKGVRALAESLVRRRQREARAEAKAARMDAPRERMEARGYQAIGGVDEAGRGPLAGPVYTACVVLGPDHGIRGLDDSKKLSRAAREALVPEIEAKARGFAVARADAERIDERNILRATREAMAEAVARCRPVAPDYLITDAVHLPEVTLPFEAMVKADSRVAEVAAASVLAKVARDRFMVEADERYPGYGFADHKGYGTEQHMEALERLGPCPLHRRSFAPVARWVLPTVEELSRRMRAASSRMRLREVGDQVRAQAHDLTDRELERLRELYRECERRLGG